MEQTVKETANDLAEIAMICGNLAKISVELGYPVISKTFILQASGMMDQVILKFRENKAKEV